jgi:hypothetical protein
VYGTPGIRVVAGAPWTAPCGGCRGGCDRRVFGTRKQAIYSSFFIAADFGRKLRSSCTMVGMGTSFGDDSDFGEDQTQCIFCKQRDIFLLASLFYRSDDKSSCWNRIRA